VGSTECLSVTRNGSGETTGLGGSSSMTVHILDDQFSLRRISKLAGQRIIPKYRDKCIWRSNKKNSR
jgi:hypothetical protein